MTSVELKNFYTNKYTGLSDEEKQAYAFAVPFVDYIESLASSFPVGSGIETAYLNMVGSPGEYQWVADNVLASVSILRNFSDLVRINGYS